MAQSILRPIPKVNGFSLSRPKIFPILLFIALMLAVSLFYVWSRLQVINLEYSISSLEGRLRNLQQESRGLQVEVASLRSPQRIEQVAQRKLGLHLPRPEQVITIN
jgi:cell division protein FtsL